MLLKNDFFGFGADKERLGRGKKGKGRMKKQKKKGTA